MKLNFTVLTQIGEIYIEGSEESVREAAVAGWELCLAPLEAAVTNLFFLK